MLRLNFLPTAMVTVFVILPISLCQSYAFATARTTILPAPVEPPSGSCAYSLRSNHHLPQLEFDITQMASWSFGQDYQKTRLEPQMGTAIPREYTSFKTLELVGKVELRSRKIAIVHVTITRNDETTATAEIYATSESGDETGQKIVLNSNPVFKLSGKVWNGWMQIFSGAYLDEGGTPRQIQLSLGWEQETDRPNSPPHAGSDLGSQILPFTN